MAACEQIQDELSAYLDGELSAQERAAVDAHLKGCAACQALLSELKGVQGALADVPKLAAPPALAAKIREGVSAGAPASEAVHEKVIAMPVPWQQRVFGGPGLVGLAALVMVGVLVFAVLPRLGRDDYKNQNVAVSAKKAPAATGDVKDEKKVESKSLEKSKAGKPAGTRLESEKPDVDAAAAGDDAAPAAPMPSAAPDAKPKDALQKPVPQKQMRPESRAPLAPTAPPVAAPAPEVGAPAAERLREAAPSGDASRFKAEGDRLNRAPSAAAKPGDPRANTNALSEQEARKSGGAHAGGNAARPEEELKALHLKKADVERGGAKTENESRDGKALLKDQQQDKSLNQVKKELPPAAAAQPGHAAQEKAAAKAPADPGFGGQSPAAARGPRDANLDEAKAAGLRSDDRDAQLAGRPAEDKAEKDVARRKLDEAREGATAEAAEKKRKLLDEKAEGGSGGMAPPKPLAEGKDGETGPAFTEITQLPADQMLRAFPGEDADEKAKREQKEKGKSNAELADGGGAGKNSSEPVRVQVSRNQNAQKLLQDLVGKFGGRIAATEPAKKADVEPNKDAKGDEVASARFYRILVPAARREALVAALKNLTPASRRESALANERLQTAQQAQQAEEMLEEQAAEKKEFSKEMDDKVSAQATVLVIVETDVPEAEAAPAAKE
ncbi:MAG TPA: zf-HC2 domain-containing protein [Planctomycetota bacterium]|nr:zf-HC2 domain-containing protein [Planctomycetota bacterium]